MEATYGPGLFLVLTDSSGNLVVVSEEVLYVLRSLPGTGEFLLHVVSTSSHIALPCWVHIDIKPTSKKRQ